MADRRSGMVQSMNYSNTGSIFNRAAAAAVANSRSTRRSGRGSKRYSVSTFYSMAAEQDLEVDDELTQAQRLLRDLKSKISSQSKQNFLREQDVRNLDMRIGMLIHQRMALEDLEEHDDTQGHYLDDRRMQQYGNLFYLLQSEPRHIATMCRLVDMSEIDRLLQTVMFTLYGNQYESREEHLLLSMFQNVLSSQFESTSEFTSLMRANTPTSRMMTTYTRRGPGQSYLRAVLGPEIKKLMDNDDLDLEIDPLKVYHAMYDDIRREDPEAPPCPSFEDASEHPKVRSAIVPRLRSLMTIATSFLKAIIRSKDKVPYGIRWICKQIRSLTRRKFPSKTDSEITTMIGGFFFLRFINPAIATPQTYLLTDRAPNAVSRTALKLVAKLLQNLANKPSYTKEPYMRPTNYFIDKNKDHSNHFLNDLCEIGDFYESLEMDQYMALSKKDIMISITPNEIYSTHALLQKHIDTLAPSSSDHLRDLLNEVGQAPALVPRREDKPIELPLFSRWEIPIQDLAITLMSENGITQNDILYMDAKAIFVQIIRSLPQLEKSPLKLMSIADAAATTKNIQLVQKGIRVKEILLDLERVGVVDRRDGFKLLVEEIFQELAHLGDLKKKVKEEIVSLQDVHKILMDQDEYLKGQLDTYRVYLQNVRIQSAGGIPVGVVPAGSGANNNSGSVRTQIGIGVEADGKVKKKKAPRSAVPYTLSFESLHSMGVIVQSAIPEHIWSQICVDISPVSGGRFFLKFRRRDGTKAILEFDAALDDLLEKQQDHILLDLDLVILHVGKTLDLLNEKFLSKNKRIFP